jgi:hypothetical protein
VSVVGPILAGDYNRNGAVDAADYVVWLRSVGQSGSSLPADGNANGIVDQEDFDIWRANFGSTTPGGSMGAEGAVPEPTSRCLFFGITLAMLSLPPCRSSRREANRGSQRMRVREIRQTTQQQIDYGRSHECLKSRSPENARRC